MRLPSPLRAAVTSAAIFAVWATARPATAGPPYLTDDPQPTELGHWEIYNFINGSNDAAGLDGEAGVDLNYGAAKDLQLTAVLPLAYGNTNGFFSRGLRTGTGVIELAAKYKFLHADDNGWSPDVSVFPRFFTPTDHRYGSGHVGLLLPVWAEKDAGPWQVFGGGGYQINPGAGNRNFLQGGVAINRTINTRLSLGIEVFSQAHDTVESHGFTTVDAAVTYKLTGHWSLLTSAGPTWLQGGSHGEVFYLALKADY